MTRKVCVVTSTRADFGLLKGLIEDLRQSEAFVTQLLVTGTHLSPEFGHSIDEIHASGLAPDAQVEMLVSGDTRSATIRSFGLGMMGFADALSRLEPHVLVVLGDRYEILAAAAAGVMAGVPIAHLHGGECTEGAIDDAFRHAITKLSTLHFVAAEPYRRRVIQMGEHPERVHLVGGLGVDAVLRTPRMARATLESSLGFRFRKQNLLVTFHPITRERGGGIHQMKALLNALDRIEEVGLIFTMPNADTGNASIRSLINDFVSQHANAQAYTSLGQQRYLSCMGIVDGVVGNSSSGLIEAPSMRVGTVDIGDRQTGRLRASSVVHCEPDSDAIHGAISRILSPSFRAVLAETTNPYGDGGACARIVQVLSDAPLPEGGRKTFLDLPWGSLGEFE